MIRRHSATAIFMHWYNAACWLLLLFTGFALLANPLMQPVGDWWSSLWTGAFGALGLLRLHVVVGMAWIVLYAAYLLVRARAEALPFLKEITDLHIGSDLVWCLRKGLWLVLGERLMRRLGLDPELPPQGFYNAGQKLVAIIAVLVAVAIPTFSSQLHKARVATDWANVRSYYAQLQYEFMETGEINKDYLKEFDHYGGTPGFTSFTLDGQTINLRTGMLWVAKEDHNQGYNILYACTSGHPECVLILPMS